MKELLNYLHELGDIKYLISILHWELDTIAPEKSKDYLISVKTKLEMRFFEKTTSDKYITLLNRVIASDEFKDLSFEEQVYLKSLQEDFKKDKKVPVDFYEKYKKLLSESTNAWAKAKRKKDYKIFEPFLKKVIEMTQKYYEYRYPEEDLYNCMLNEYETGMTKEIIDPLFDALKKEVIPIIKGLKPVPLKEYNVSYSEDELKEIARIVLEYIGFECDRGALGIYPHGYTCTLNIDDVRIAFSDNKSIFDFLSTIVHEGGHGIFEQSIGTNLKKYLTYENQKLALHESQSRFYENILGRSKSFWIPIFDKIKPLLKIDITLDEFIKYFNNAKPSLIRTEADELTYTLHIIMRYEIERDLFSGKITSNELPAIWNKKTKEYLGLDVPSDSEGILQDSHWSDAGFGYFPDYLLGTIFDGMLLEKINKELGNVDKLLENGNITKITKFLKENIYIYGGSYNINEVASRVCNQDLDIKPIVKYFQDKYGEK